MASSSLPALRRALLYIPASSPRFLAKSLTLKVDNVTYDLEDAVTDHMKPTARTALQQHLSSVSKQNTSIGEIAVRINGLSTPHAIEDIQAVAALPNVDAIVVPKVNSADDLALVEDVIRQAAPHRFGAVSSDPENNTNPKPLTILALIESAKAIMDLRSICTATPNLRALIFGAEDLAQDLSLRRTPNMDEMAYARGALVTASRAFGLDSPIDAVCTLIQNDRVTTKVLQSECDRGRTFGFGGKQCIHPNQVPMVQHLYGVERALVRWAIRVLMGDEKASADRRGAWVLQGNVIDAPVVARARAVLARAQQCGRDIDAIRKEVEEKDFERELKKKKKRIGM